MSDSSSASSSTISSPSSSYALPFYCQSDLQILFERDDADLILRCTGPYRLSSATTFRVHKLVLGMASPVLAAMFTPPSQDGTIQELELPEDSSTVRWLLQACYPVEDSLPALNNVVNVWIAANKYAMRVAIAKLLKPMSYLSREKPFDVYLATRSLEEFSEHATSAFWQCLRKPWSNVLEVRSSTLEYITASDLQWLLRTHRNAAKIALEVIGSHRHKVPAAAKSPFWAHCWRCGPALFSAWSSGCLDRRSVLKKHIWDILLNAALRIVKDGAPLGFVRLMSPTISQWGPSKEDLVHMPFAGSSRLGLNRAGPYNRNISEDRGSSTNHALASPRLCQRCANATEEELTVFLGPLESTIRRLIRRQIQPDPKQSIGPPVLRSSGPLIGRGVPLSADKDDGSGKPLLDDGADDDPPTNDTHVDPNFTAPTDVAPPPNRLFWPMDAGDAFLRSRTDGMYFRVSMRILASVSPAFHEMFQEMLASPPRTPMPVFSLDEDSKTIDWLLRLCYPVTNPMISNSDPGVLDLAAATKKYGIAATKKCITEFAKSHATVRPLYAYIIMKTAGLPGAREAAKCCVRKPLSYLLETVEPGLDRISSKDFKYLVDLHHKGMKAARNSIPKLRTSLRVGDLCARWLSCHRCRPALFEPVVVGHRLYALANPDRYRERSGYVPRGRWWGVVLTEIIQHAEKNGPIGYSTLTPIWCLKFDFRSGKWQGTGSSPQLLAIIDAARSKIQRGLCAQCIEAAEDVLENLVCHVDGTIESEIERYMEALDNRLVCELLCLN